jgi:hypothetical protein
MLVVAVKAAQLEILDLHQPEDITVVVMVLLELLVLVDSVVAVAEEQRYY